MTKILFLDVDDVICTVKYNLISDDIWRAFDPVSCRLVEHICKETGAKIVLSSSWGATKWTLEEFHKQIDKACPSLREHFFDEEFTIYGDDNKYKTRYRLINEWLKRHNVDNFCIIDDDFSWTGDRPSKLVIVEGYNGIGFDDVKDCINILGKNE